MADRTTLNQEIDKQLRLQRKDRYDPRDDTWLDEVADSIPDDLLPEEEVRRRFKRDMVKRREGVATRRANQLLRKFNANDQLEWHWWNEANEPIALEWTDFDEDGKAVKHQERVALRATTPRDLRLWAQNELVRAQHDYDARVEAVEGARKIASEIEAGGYGTFLVWAESAFPEIDSA